MESMSTAGQTTSASGATISASALSAAAGHFPHRGLWLSKLENKTIEQYVNQNQLAMNNLETLQQKLYNAIEGIVSLSVNFEKNIDWIGKLLSSKEEDIMLGDGSVVPNLFKHYNALRAELDDFKNALENRIDSSLHSNQNTIEAELRQLRIKVNEFIQRIETKDTYTKTELDVWLRQMEMAQREKLGLVDVKIAELQDAANNAASLGIPIAKPNILSPASGADEQDGIIEASAISVGEGYVFEHYKLVAEVDDNDLFTHSRVLEITDNHRIYIDSLEPNTRYYVRVRYVAGNFASAFSDIVRFTTAASLEPPIEIPEGGDKEDKDDGDDKSPTITPNPSEPKPSETPKDFGIVPPTIEKLASGNLTFSPFNVFYGAAQPSSLPRFRLAKLQSFGQDNELNYVCEFGEAHANFAPSTSTLSSTVAANIASVESEEFADVGNVLLNNTTTQSKANTEKGSITITYKEPQYARHLTILAPTGSAPYSFKLWGQTDAGENLLLHKTEVAYSNGASTKFAIEDCTNAYYAFRFEVTEGESTRMCILHCLQLFTQSAPRIVCDLNNATIPQGTHKMRVGYRSEGGYVFGANKELAFDKAGYIGYIYREDLNIIRSLGTSYDKDWRLASILTQAMNNAQDTAEYVELANKRVYANIGRDVIDIASDAIIDVRKLTLAEQQAAAAKTTTTQLYVHFPHVFVIAGTLTCNAKTYEILVMDSEPFELTITSDMLLADAEGNFPITFSTPNIAAANCLPLLQNLGKITNGSNTTKITLQAVLHPAFYGKTKICDELWLSAYHLSGAALNSRAATAGASAFERSTWNANIAQAVGENVGKLRIWTFWDWHLVWLLRLCGAQRFVGGRNAYQNAGAPNSTGECHESAWKAQNVDGFFGLRALNQYNCYILIDGAIAYNANSLKIAYSDCTSSDTATNEFSTAAVAPFYGIAPQLGTFTAGQSLRMNAGAQYANAHAGITRGKYARWRARSDDDVLF